MAFSGSIANQLLTTYPTNEILGYNFFEIFYHSSQYFLSASIFPACMLSHNLRLTPTKYKQNENLGMLCGA